MTKKAELAPLQAAIGAGQLLRLLGEARWSNKAAVKSLSRLRSKLENLVVQLALSPAVDSSAGELVANQLRCLHEALCASFLRYLDIRKVLDLRGGGDGWFPARATCNEAALVAARRLNFHALLLEEADAASGRPLAKSASQADRARILHAFASAVRNSSWHLLLLRMGLTLKEAARYDVALREECSSATGREALSGTLEVLCPGAGPAVKGAPGSDGAQDKALYVTYVALRPESLLVHPKVSVLFEKASGTNGLELEGPPVGDLLSVATCPQEVLEGEQPAAVAQRKLDELIESLTARAKAVTAARAKARRAAEKVAAAEALEKLRALDPKLLKALRANPGLLDKL